MKKITYYLNQSLNEAKNKATVFSLKKLKYFSRDSIINLLNNIEFDKKRVTIEKDIVGGTKKDVKLFIKKLIENDKKATAELKFDITKEQLDDYKYLKGVK